MKALTFGDVTVRRLVEAEGPGFHPGFLLPDSNADDIAEQASWLLPHFLDTESGRFIQSVHTYVIRTPRHTILVDTCVGNHKDRPSTKAWHRMETPWLENLKRLGVDPEAVDFVLCTHLHVDHVGWNTRLENGRWVPTFPNAAYLFHTAEYAYWEEVRDMDPAVGFGRTEGCFADSVLPVMEAGQALLVEDGYRIDDALWLEHTPGHSPGHVCLNLETGGAQAVFSGGLLHHPVQCAYPDWNSRYCENAVQSRAARRGFIERNADTNTLVLAAHFATPTAGRIVSNGQRCIFEV
jgi:glyoxylase-like metal-dependent hydrolase (beta-lactamase superfamily II)